MKPQLNLITLGVNDLKRMRAFYEDGLGWKASSASQDDVVFFQLGAVVLSLFPSAALADDAMVPADGQGFRRVTLAHNVASRPEVAAVLAEAVAAGARLLKPASDVFWGGHSGYFADPEDNIWEVAFNPFFTLDDSGALRLP